MASNCALLPIVQRNDLVENQHEGRPPVPKGSESIRSMRLQNNARTGSENARSTDRLEQIGREILDIAAGRTEIRTMVSQQPGGVVATRTEVHFLPDDHAADAASR
jgi:hypothetical protein